MEFGHVGASPSYDCALVLECFESVGAFYTKSSRHSQHIIREIVCQEHVTEYVYTRFGRDLHRNWTLFLIGCDSMARSIAKDDLQ